MFGCPGSSPGKDACLVLSDCLTGYVCTAGTCVPTMGTGGGGGGAGGGGETDGGTDGGQVHPSDEYTGTWIWTQNAMSTLVFDAGTFTWTSQSTSYDTATHMTTVVGVMTLTGSYAWTRSSSGGGTITEMTIVSQALGCKPTGGVDEAGTVRTQNNRPEICCNSLSYSCTPVTRVVTVSFSGAMLVLESPEFSGPLVFNKKP
jgi:hypothetical protein